MKYEVSTCPFLKLIWRAVQIVCEVGDYEDLAPGTLRCILTNFPIASAILNLKPTLNTVIICSIYLVSNSMEHSSPMWATFGSCTQTRISLAANSISKVFSKISVSTLEQAFESILDFSLYDLIMH